MPPSPPIANTLTILSRNSAKRIGRKKTLQPLERGLISKQFWFDTLAARQFSALDHQRHSRPLGTAPKDRKTARRIIKKNSLHDLPQPDDHRSPVATTGGSNGPEAPKERRRSAGLDRANQGSESPASRRQPPYFPSLSKMGTSPSCARP